MHVGVSDSPAVGGGSPPRPPAAAGIPDDNDVFRENTSPAQPYPPRALGETPVPTPVAEVGPAARTDDHPQQPAGADVHSTSSTHYSTDTQSAAPLPADTNTASNLNTTVHAPKPTHASAGPTEQPTTVGRAPVRTPSPVLADEPDGHLSFPPVGGLDSIEREMQVLIDADDIGIPVHPALLADIYERLGKLGITAESLESQSPESQLGIMAELIREVQQRDEANDRMRHNLRVTRLAALSMLSSLRVSYSHMLQAERDIKARLELELSGSKSQSRMLSDMVSRASIHSEDAVEDGSITTSPIVSERNKLLSDRRFLRQRVHDAESQVARLESELRALRPLLLRQQPAEEEVTRSPQSSRRRDVIMGDAKSEHLILAARMLRTLRHRTARDPPKTPRREPPSSPEGPMTPRLSVGAYPATPQNAHRRPQLPRIDDWRKTIQSPFSSGIDELLHAAHSLTGEDAQSPSKRTHRDWSGPSSAPVFGSPKRQRVERMDVDSSESSDRYSTSPTRLAPVSALDVLADQASEIKPAEGPTSAPVAGGKHSPEKRLPYVRWSAEEDVKLRKAIKEHGQRWEFVARAVGTRSYHQCRQRYLLIRRKEAAASGLTSPSRSNPSPRAPAQKIDNGSSSDEGQATPQRSMTRMPVMTPPRIAQYMPGALPSPVVPGASPVSRAPPPPQPFTRTPASPAIYS